MDKLRIVVGGFIGLFPTGGATWDYIQYPLGLKLMGHDVYYIEDTMSYPTYQNEGKAWDDASDNIRYVKEVMEYFGLGDKWAYRDVATGECFGMPLQKVLEVCNTADVFINVSCSSFLKDEYLGIPKRVLIDSDPMFTQIQCYYELEGLANSNTKQMLDNHNYLFTFGENIHADDCKIPLIGYKWLTTRQPVCLDLWRKKDAKTLYDFTSIMNWSGRKKLNYKGEEWGQKDVEFEKFIEVPKKYSKAKFEVVINPPINPESYFDTTKIKNYGWEVLDPHNTVQGPFQYKEFILKSRGEFSIAKETYVKSNSGWFSCRSACYLAAGKAVITQDTKWTKFIPAGQGLLAFNDVSSAIVALDNVNSDIKKHSRAAIEIAAEYFDSKIVLQKMLENLN